MSRRQLAVLGLCALPALAAAARRPSPAAERTADAGAQETAPPSPGSETERPTLHLRQTEPADVVGNDDVALKTALDRLRKTGGTLVVGPGRYVIRRSLYVPRDLVLRGEDGAVLALPSPALTAADAPAGATELVLAGAHEFAVSPTQGLDLVQILPPVGMETFADGKTAFLDFQQLVRVEGQRLVLGAPLAQPIPAGSRVGYPLKILQTHKDGLATIEGLDFEGGKLDAIPMPGHHQRCAIWAASPFGYEEELLGPPGRGVTIRRCRFRDWYGRAIALYHQVDGSVEDCRIERVTDEGIDLDHYVERFVIRGNTVVGALWGIVLNDASRNLVEGNRVEGGEIGIYAWPWDKARRPGVNEENVVRGNTVLGASQASIFLERTCVRFVVEGNEVDGEIRVIEPENTVRDNRRVPR